MAQLKSPKYKLIITQTKKADDFGAIACPPQNGANQVIGVGRMVLAQLKSPSQSGALLLIHNQADGFGAIDQKSGWFWRSKRSKADGFGAIGC